MIKRVQQVVFTCKYQYKESSSLYAFFDNFILGNILGNNSAVVTRWLRYWLRKSDRCLGEKSSTLWSWILPKSKFCDCIRSFLSFSLFFDKGLVAFRWKTEEFLGMMELGWTKVGMPLGKLDSWHGSFILTVGICFFYNNGL